MAKNNINVSEISDFITEEIDKKISEDLAKKLEEPAGEIIRILEDEGLYQSHHPGCGLVAEDLFYMIGRIINSWESKRPTIPSYLIKESHIPKDEINDVTISRIKQYKKRKIKGYVSSLKSNIDKHTE